MLSAAALAAQRYGVPLTIIRPWLQAPGLALVEDRTAGAPPSLLVLEAAEPRAPIRLLRDLIATATRVLGVRALDVSAVDTGDSLEGAPLTAHLRFSGGHVALLSARLALAPAFRLLASSAERTIELRTHDGASTFEECAAASPERLTTELATPHHLDLLRLEALRVGAAGSDRDLDLALGEAALIAAVERALEEGTFAEHVELGPRPFQVLRGGRRTTAPAGFWRRPHAVPRRPLASPEPPAL